MSPGGRTDILYRCNETGFYDIISSNNTQVDNGTFHDILLNMNPKVYPHRTLVTIQVVGDSEDGAIPESIPYTLPNSTDYPPKPIGSYLEAFHSLPGDPDCSQHSCFNLSFAAGASINKKQFNLSFSGNTFRNLIDNFSLSLFAGDELDDEDGYEFFINNGGAHVYHQHINPFHVTGGNGFISLNNTWWDTLGNYGGTIRAKMHTRGDWYYPDNYTGNTEIDSLAKRFFGKGGGLIIVHCHLLQHEGMMDYIVCILRNIKKFDDMLQNLNIFKDFRDS